MGKRPLAAAFALWWIVFASWSLATPVWGAPDEFQHAFRAYAAVRGEIYVKPVAASFGTGGFVRVPKGWVAAANSHTCFAHHTNVTPECESAITNNATPTRIASTAARYNPMYYLIVGIGSLLAPPVPAMWIMRLISAALSAFFIAWAFTSARATKHPVLGAATVLLATTPMVAFMASGINPSGFEIAAAVSAWVNGILMLASDRTELQPVFTRRAFISAMAFVATRGLSPLWLMVMSCVLILAFVGRDQFHEMFVRERKWLAALIAVVVAAAVWTVVAKSLILNVDPHPLHASYWQRLSVCWNGFRRQFFLLRSAVGVYGWTDTISPIAASVPWLVAVVMLGVVAARRSSARLRASFELLIIAVFALPTLLEAHTFNTSGFVWQGRYTMPISLGLPLLFGLVLAMDSTIVIKRARKIAIAAGMCLLAIYTDIYGFLVALRRNITGTGHAISLHGSWHPVLPAVFLILLNAIALLFVAREVLKSPISENTV